MSERVTWSREDVIVAYALYCIIPLNQIRLTNRLIQQVAEGFSHSASSLVMRMQNFAAIDPNSKVKGAKPFRSCRTTSERTYPANGLLLNTFYDKAFDQGLITVLPDYTIRCSALIHRQTDDFTNQWLIGLEGKTIALPERFYPNTEYLEYHNDVIFKG